jgi:hypothetical protein
MFCYEACGHISNFCIHCKNYTAIYAVRYTLMIPARAPLNQPIITVVALWGEGGGVKKRKGWPVLGLSIPLHESYFWTVTCEPISGNCS